MTLDIDDIPAESAFVAADGVSVSWRYRNWTAEVRESQSKGPCARGGVNMRFSGLAWSACAKIPPFVISTLCCYS